MRCSILTLFRFRWLFRQSLLIISPSSVDLNPVIAAEKFRSNTPSPTVALNAVPDGRLLSA
jgi:hypothetical protein